MDQIARIPGQDSTAPDGLDNTNHQELENRCGRIPTVGSNPTLSARIQRILAGGWYAEFRQGSPRAALVLLLYFHPKSGWARETAA